MIKKDLIDEAFERIGLSAYTFDMQPEQYQSALKKLDVMVASWGAIGIRIGYPISHNAELTEILNIPDSAIEAIVTNLSIRIAGSFGKVLSADDKLLAKQALNNLMIHTTEIIEMKLPNTLPSGAGNKKFRNDEFIKKEVEQIEAGNYGLLDI